MRRSLPSRREVPILAVANRGPREILGRPVVKTLHFQRIRMEDPPRPPERNPGGSKNMYDPRECLDRTINGFLHLRIRRANRINGRAPK